MAVVCLTFDVDAESGLGPDLAASRHRLSTLSEHEFSVRRGLPRIADLLGEHRMRATFYVPGATAQRWPEAIQALVDSGHEVAHHGHDHLRSHEIDEARQTAEIDEGLAALRPYLGEAFGYRSPAWELTPHTAGLLLDRGFAYDSSLMGDDRPHWLDTGGGRILELPIHWSLDDYIWFGMGRGTQATATSAWLEAWSDELSSAEADDRPTTLTFHPEVIGRGYRAIALGRLLAQIAAAGAEVVTHGELAERVRTGSSPGSGPGRPD
jgi:peptidoglycan/xylan/chitin deacetylase (PgdA/CDA1 family)